VARNRSGTELFDRRFRALRVYWPTSTRLRWQASADRRAGLPLGLNPGTTPVLQGLVARHDDACERERTRFHVETEPLAVRLRQLEAELPAALAVLAARGADVVSTSVRPTAEQLALRLAGEQDLPAALIRQRRQTTYDRAAAAARAAHERAQQAVDALLGEQAQLDAQLRNRLDVARSRVLRYGDFMRRQASIYRRALIRKHPDREALAHDWQTDLRPAPTWVADDLLPSAREAGVAA
jgi:multidrug efflux pump subunit AcrA (membrane-fusion protein)